MRPDSVYDAIGISPDCLTVVNEDGMPALYPRSIFEIIDDSDTLTWHWEWSDIDDWYGGPHELHEQGFLYVDYYEDDPRAVEVFERFRKEKGLRPRGERWGGDVIE